MNRLQALAKEQQTEEVEYSPRYVSDQPILGKVVNLTPLSHSFKTLAAAAAASRATVAAGTKKLDRW